MRFLAIGICALAIIPAVSGAQRLTTSSGPTLQAASVGFHVNEVKVDGSTKVTADLARPRAGQDVALMAVGVGTMIVGALIDNNTASTIIIIGGAAMALFGLYHYLE
jgi:hypothetical protein